MSLNFCENNIGFYTGTLKICKKNIAEGTSYRFDAIDPPIPGTHDLSPFFLTFGRHVPSPEVITLELPSQQISRN